MVKIGKDAVRDKFFIKDIENITGIKAHTIRIWEQRYSIITPKRTDTQIRYYDEEDLRFILNVSILNSNGYKISRIAKMSKEDVQRKCQAITEVNSKYDQQIQSLVAAMLAFDEKEFNKILAINILKLGLEETMIHIVFSFMEQVGILWLAGTIHPAHEHFISSLIRQRLFVSIDNLNGNVKENSKKFLLFVPTGESHDLGLLFANYLLRSRGHHVIYLGSSLPFEDLYKIFTLHKPDYIFSTITSLNSNVSIQGFINNMAKHWPETTILLTGAQVVKRKNLRLYPNIQIIDNPDNFLNFLKKLQ